MTTIAYRAGILAADTAPTMGGTQQGRMTKIAKRGRALAGSAGSASYCHAFLEWFQHREKDKPPVGTEDDHSIDRGVIIRPCGKIEVYEPKGKFVIGAEYFAIGSGRDTALGAMFAGCDAETAVRAAIAHDPYTSGDVMVLKR